MFKKQNKKKLVYGVLGFLVLLIIFFSITSNKILGGAAFIPLPWFDPNIFPTPPGTTGVDKLKALVGFLFEGLRFGIGAFAVLWIVVSGVRMIFAAGNEETYSKARTGIFWAIVGLTIVGISGELSSILTLEHGTFLRDPNVAIKQSRVFSRLVEIIVTFIRYSIGGIAIFSIIRSGSRLILHGGNEEEVGKDKKNIGYAIIGLLFILLATPLVNTFFKVDKTRFPGSDGVKVIVNAEEGVKTIAFITNLVISVVGPLTILALIGGSIYYLISAGEEEKMNKAKRLILWALIGLIVIYGAFGIVSTFIIGKFEGI